MEEIKNEQIILVGRPERKKHLAITKCRWKDNIKIGLKEMEYESVD
jgi:hypothetical protein